ncbi:MAG: hypothetical protein ACI37Q_06340 [Candidatus Gastranaerophilaceae bacterium]
MISNVNFTGRETLLTSALPKAKVDTFHQYVGAGSILPKVEETFVKEVKAVKETAAEVVAKAVQKQESAELSYAISHGTPKEEVGKLVDINV